MPSTLVVGSQWGDEGKGKIIDFLAGEADFVVRYQGGNNAGHTVVVESKTFKLHLLPSGVIRNKRSLIGAGVVLDPKVIVKEIEALREQGFEPNLCIDFRTQIIMPYHCMMDSAKDSSLKEKKIGTTGRGIGPCYADKAFRSGIRFSDLIEEKKLKETIAANYFFYSEFFGKVFGQELPFTESELFEEFNSLGQQLKKYAGDVSIEVNKALRENKNVLIEGAQGTMLDNSFGTYPYVTASHPIAGGACTGIGLSPKKINRIIGVVKAYTTRVGEGPFPTELFGEKAEHLIEKGLEYGTTTGRQRRVGWIDLPLLRYSSRLSGFDEIAITKLDVLNGMEKLMVAESYSFNAGKIEEFPPYTAMLEKTKPNYVEFEGFVLGEKEKLSARKKGFVGLPEEAKNYLNFIEEKLSVPIKIISYGSERNDTIVR
ncbi:MAG: adenylosuccinate synthase [Candidatus Diapherotrites archaeon]